MTAHLRVDHSPFHRLIGLEMIRAEDGTVEMRLPWRDELGRADGSDWFHGGVISALIDIAGDYAIASKLGRGVPTIDLRVDYHAAAMPGDLTARGKVIRMGGQFSCAEAQVLDKDGKLLASGRGTYFTAPPPPPKG